MPSLYAITIPVFIQKLHSLDHLLAKAIASGLDEQDLFEARLAPDMFPLSRQVQIACDTAKLAATRLAQIGPRAMADEEKSLAELRERIARTIAYLEEADPAAFEGRETAEITLEFPNMKMTFSGQSLVTDFTLPNFYFHLTIAYALLRMKGVSIGKMDFLAGAQAPG
ncbi:DUF1993 family protein [Novosphingobium sp. Fuku2-ISO-50]|uniref:DUF1993 domain-containing protein n=1 Tax=Novosphingobium sp. Fuku2-ISO-50 TaxID=1739114 RepID=UPI00076D2325|nr:DUF1993 domain-containing protein [Novosphingobium sp. Fuku2-ISO-50]KUR78734.1 hypothetical protein AQZ50_06085 [Novosphingobium sp. Fuku2-ISO-50]